MFIHSKVLARPLAIAGRSVRLWRGSHCCLCSLSARSRSHLRRCDTKPKRRPTTPISSRLLSVQQRAWRVRTRSTRPKAMGQLSARQFCRTLNKDFANFLDRRSALGTFGRLLRYQSRSTSRALQKKHSNRLQREVDRRKRTHQAHVHAVGNDVIGLLIQADDALAAARPESIARVDDPQRPIAKGCDSLRRSLGVAFSPQLGHRIVTDVETGHDLQKTWSEFEAKQTAPTHQGNVASRQLVLGLQL